ncbi:hypothetical protein [Agrilutibacter solisilvae]|uniref:Uncharacterized protein n=1 Tax=Agrilutibacter solisilvae TaxID=2763317 RepID=A0A974XX15_9GAMM|nr:hypothetical protein [Lysobacter solisilvae]QSX77387.1 hypothetical protein I8J32_011505 [Lysobacter solisilvae]
MIKAAETRILRALLRQLDARSTSVLQSRWLIILMWPVTAAVFLVLFQLEPTIGSVGIAIGSMLVGAAVATVAIYRGAFEQWAVVRRFLDQEAIRSRLRELEA